LHGGDGAGTVAFGGRRPVLKVRVHCTMVLL
jgi:hypothetical protein